MKRSFLWKLNSDEAVYRASPLCYHMHHDGHAEMLSWQPKLIITVCTTQCCFFIHLTQQQTLHKKGWELKTESFLKKSNFLLTSLVLFLFRFSGCTECPFKVSLYVCSMQYFSQ